MAMRSVGDVVAIHINNQPSIYARVESIQADVKPRWLQVKLLFLSFPPQEVTWILRAEYLDGATFTMNDVPVRILPVRTPGSPLRRHPLKPDQGTAEVISMDLARVKKDLGRKEDPSGEH